MLWQTDQLCFVICKGLIHNSRSSALGPNLCFSRYKTLYDSVAVSSIFCVAKKITSGTGEHRLRLPTAFRFPAQKSSPHSSPALSSKETLEKRRLPFDWSRQISSS